MSAIKVGTEVPISLDVGDGNDTLFVRAKVLRPDQTQLSQFNLTPRGDGRYSFTGFLMPDLDYILIKYSTFTDPGYSVPADYYQTSESFIKNEASGSGASDELISVINKALTDLRAVEVEMDIEESQEIDMDIINIDNGEIELNVSIEEEQDILLMVENNEEVIIDVIVEDAGNIELTTPS